MQAPAHLRTMLKRRAFTVIELTVAIAVLGIISTLVIINVTQSRRNSRDTIRKADISSVLTAVSQFSLANGTSFITYPDVSNANRPGACTLTSSNNPSETGTGNFCVGASGRSYGLINVAADPSTTLTLNGVGVPGAPARQYQSHSIVQALKDGGYFNSAPKDPLNSKGTLGNADAGKVYDYALIRACPNGQQHVGKRGQLFAVWAILESPRKINDADLLSRVPGYITATPDTAGGYDFAAGDIFQDLFQTKGFGVSNGSSQPQNVSSAGSCATSA